MGGGGGGCEVILITRFYPPPPPPPFPQRSREFNSTVLRDTLLHPPPPLPSPIVTRIAHVRSREFLITGGGGGGGGGIPYSPIMAALCPKPDHENDVRLVCKFHNTCMEAVYVCMCDLHVGRC